MKILKQQQSLCALFSAASIFRPNVTIDQMQHVINKYAINPKVGLTLPQENLVLSEFTNYQLQLVPRYLDYENKLSNNSIRNVLEYTEITEDLFFTYALIVDSNTMKHRIWVLYNDYSKITIIDTYNDKTISCNLDQLCTKYNIVGVFGLYSMKDRNEILLNHTIVKHLI